MKGLESQTFKARCWASNKLRIGQLSVICKKHLMPVEEMEVTRPDGTKFKTNHHGYLMVIKTPMSNYIVDPDTVELVEELSGVEEQCNQVTEYDTKFKNSLS